eukprot:gene17984-biopygen18929
MTIFLVSFNAQKDLAAIMLSDACADCHELLGSQDTCAGVARAIQGCNPYEHPWLCAIFGLGGAGVARAWPVTPGVTGQARAMPAPRVCPVTPWPCATLMCGRRRCSASRGYASTRRWSRSCARACRAGRKVESGSGGCRLLRIMEKCNLTIGHIRCIVFCVVMGPCRSLAWCAGRAGGALPALRNVRCQKGCRGKVGSAVAGLAVPCGPRLRPLAQGERGDAAPCPAAPQKRLRVGELVGTTAPGTITHRAHCAGGQAGPPVGRNGRGRIRDASVLSNSIVRHTCGARQQPFLPGSNIITCGDGTFSAVRPLSQPARDPTWDAAAAPARRHQEPRGGGGGAGPPIRVAGITRNMVPLALSSRCRWRAGRVL